MCIYIVPCNMSYPYMDFNLSKFETKLWQTLNIHKPHQPNHWSRMYVYFVAWLQRNEQKTLQHSHIKAARYDEYSHIASEKPPLCNNCVPGVWAEWYIYTCAASADSKVIRVIGLIFFLLGFIKRFYGFMMFTARLLLFFTEYSAATPASVCRVDDIYVLWTHTSIAYIWYNMDRFRYIHTQHSSLFMLILDNLQSWCWLYIAELFRATPHMINLFYGFNSSLCLTL